MRSLGRKIYDNPEPNPNLDLTLSLIWKSFEIRRCYRNGKFRDNKNPVLSKNDIIQFPNSISEIQYGFFVQK